MVLFCCSSNFVVNVFKGNRIYKFDLVKSLLSLNLTKPDLTLTQIFEFAIINTAKIDDQLYMIGITYNMNNVFKIQFQAMNLDLL